MPGHSKLVLPTIETCPWRTTGGGRAECGLVASMLGTRADELAVVSDDACRACCQSFPPTARQLNPVVASLLFAAASRIIEVGGVGDCEPDKAVAVRDFAENSLELAYPAHFQITPARSVLNCCWLGDPLPDAAQPGEGDGRPETFDPCASHEPVRTCRHANHDWTTPSRCRMCRDWATRTPVSRSLSLQELVPPPPHRCGPTVSRWAVGVTTGPRRRATLEDCLDGIIRSGFEDPHLFLDGTAQVPLRYQQLSTSWREHRIGAWPAWYFALAELCLLHPDVDAYMLLQDDVVLYDRESLRTYLERVLWPGERPGLVTLFYSGETTTPGWHTGGDLCQWGALGLIFPQTLARALLSDAELGRTWLTASCHKHFPIPEMVGDWAQRAGIDVWHAVPSLSQHIGNTSTIWADAPLAGSRRAVWCCSSIEDAFAAEESLAAFPEDAFLCDPCEREEYRRRQEAGRTHMQNASVVICGLCRDVRHFLPRTAERIERLGAMFREYHVVLVENDSVDATREFLMDWKAVNTRVDVISETLGVKKHPTVRSRERAMWMAQCRNRYRERILNAHPDVDYVIVVDTDLPGGWSYDGIAHSFGSQDWDFVGSYGIICTFDASPDEVPYYHYDVWAFRPARGTAPRQLVDHTRLDLRRGASLLPVESCFGGLGVYRRECFVKAEYGGADCEHVVFHDRLRQAGLTRLFLNPSQIVLYSPF